MTTRVCSKCGKVLTDKDSFEWEGKPVCVTCAGILSRAFDDVSKKAPEKLGFNFGAFAITGLWLMFHGRVGTGILMWLFYISISIIAELNILYAPGIITLWLVEIGLSVYFGFIGNRIAWAHKNCRSVVELKKKEEGWNIVGMILTSLGGLWIVLAIVGLAFGR